jgi:actin-like ATPase involved in cell morphogenesis
LNLAVQDRQIINNPEHKRHAEIKTRIQYRLNHLKEDLRIIEETEPELADDIREQICQGAMSAELRDVFDDIETQLRERREAAE